MFARDRSIPVLCRCLSALAGFLLAGCTGDIGENDTGGVGDVGDIGGNDMGTPQVPGTLPVDATLGIGATGIRRMTVWEYDNTLRDLLGDTSRPGAALLPEDLRAPFDNDFIAQETSKVLVEAAETLSANVAARLIADMPRRASVTGCAPGAPADTACLGAFIERFGRRAFRRPPRPEESAALLELGQTFTAPPGDVWTGVEVVLRAMLQSPEFIYHVELGTPAERGLQRLDGWSVASRMSYLLWGSAPDDVLLDAAAAGALDRGEERRAQASRMLTDRRVRAQVDRFHALWLGYERMALEADLVQRMRAETAALLDRVIFDQPSSWLSVFDSSETFIDATLATHYGLPAGAPTQASWVDVSGSGRRGILSHGTFLSSVSNPGDTSPTKRGKLIRERLMCQTIAPPPPDVKADTPPDTTVADCKWDQYAAHRDKTRCSGCHSQMDPVGFGLENFDRAGRYRTHDDGKPQCVIEGSGELVGYGKFKGPAELAGLIKNAGGVSACAVKHLLQFTAGHALEEGEGARVSALAQRFDAEGQHFDALLLDLVESDAFVNRLPMPEVQP